MCRRKLRRITASGSALDMRIQERERISSVMNAVQTGALIDGRLSLVNYIRHS